MALPLQYAKMWFLSNNIRRGIMSALRVTHPGLPIAYGAAELKGLAHTYGFMGLTISALIHFGVIGSYYLSTFSEVEPHFPQPPRGPDIIIDPTPQLPGVYTLPKPSAPTTRQPTGDAGKPVLVVDDHLALNNTLATQEELVRLVESHGVDVGSGGVAEQPEVIPDDVPPPIFVPVEKQPVVVKAVKPAYPPLALRAGIEGRVRLKIWVDRQGKVRQVEVIRSDNDIFNEPAIEAVRQFVFTPAYMNGGPVAVWVTFPFDFKLKSGE
jgi:protein TonB